MRCKSTQLQQHNITLYAAIMEKKIDLLNVWFKESRNNNFTKNTILIKDLRTFLYLTVIY